MCKVKVYEIFFCYRRAGAQTAKLFKRYLENKKEFRGTVWYSDDECYGNYKTDIVNLISRAECAVLFLTNGFTENFLERPDSYECITAQELVEIERRKQIYKDFRIITINLDGYCLDNKDQKILETLFKSAGIYKDESVGHFSQCNINNFNVARDKEEILFERLSQELLPDKYYQKQKILGNFYYRKEPTSVEIIFWDVDRGIPSKNIEFLLSSKEIAFYAEVQNAKVELNSEKQNDTMLSVVNCDCFLADEDEVKYIQIYYQPIKYELFSKCLSIWDKGRLNMSKKLMEFEQDSEQYEIPNAMGLALMVVTKDQYLIFTKRSMKRKIRKGEYDCSIVEGLKIEHDNYNIDTDEYLDMECYRAYQEEICANSEDITIQINGLILDKEYGQWNFIGTVFTEKCKEDIMYEHATRKDTYEKNTLEFIPFIKDGKKTTEFIDAGIKKFRRIGMWDTALAVLKATLLCLEFEESDIK